jgi:predicted cobalt transporter CbtA
MLFRRLVLSGLLVGLVAGLVLSAVQRWQVIPIIEQAERFEQARAPEASEAHAHAGHGDGEAWVATRLR